MCRLLAVLLVPFSFVLFAPAAPVPKHLMKEPVYYSPMAVGAKWVYEDPEGEETIIVTNIENVKGAKVVTVGCVGEENLVREKTSVSATGLSRLEWFGVAFDPPFVVLKVPFQLGDTWTFEGPNLEGSNTIRSVGQLKVPAGTFETVRVDSEYTFNSKKGASSFWYAPNVGLVKMGYDGKERVLKSFTPGKP